jgi:hypothetical protein
MTTHEIRAAMAANGGLLTWAQARDGGLSTSDIRHLVRTGALVPLRRGLYIDGEYWRSLDPHREQHRVRTRAVIAGLKRGFVVSHDSAAHELELDIVVPPVPHTHITRPGSTTAWSRYGVKHHYARYTSTQIVVVDGLEVLDAARTAVDIAREHGEPYGEIACDSALRLGVSKGALRDACAPMTNWPHILRTRRAVDFARLGAQTAIETLGRMLVEELGVGETDLQFPVRVKDGRVLWGDIRVGCHIFETDGKVKYLSPEEGGVAAESPAAIAWKAKKRDRLLSAEGLGTSHIHWEDCWPPRRAHTLVRLREEYDDTVRQFGDRLPERLVREAQEIRGQRGA